MRTAFRILCLALIALTLSSSGLLAQTDGTAQLNVTIANYVGTSGTRHWTVAWVTTESGTFIKTLWKQGPSNFPSHYGQHLGVWYTARGTSTALDGYTSSTAATYDPPNNNPIDPTWDCRDAAGALVPDGKYKFWVQYAEDSGQGPYTTSGLLWTKGPAAATTPYADQGGNFLTMSVTWTPAAATVPPTITSAAPPATGTVGTAYSHTVTATGDPAPTFAATGLPTGLSIHPTTGLISGTPTTANTFTGSITAANGVGADATQAFSITISAPVPVNIASASLEGSNLVLSGTGPANSAYTVLSSANLSTPLAQWQPAGSGTIDGTGHFSATVPIGTGSQMFTQVRVP